MHVSVIGAGAMGSLYGGLLARAGEHVTLLDTWVEHVDVIRRDGLRLDGISGDLTLPVRATTRPDEVPPADVVLILVDANTTRAAADVAARVVGPDGYAVTLQNGVGNVETLVEALGASRVLAGLSYHSAAVRGPGHVSHTHAGPTWLGELDGGRTPRLAALDAAFRAAALQPVLVDDIQGFIWSKLVHNAAINAICAVAGLRVGEISGNPGADRLQTRIIEEALAVLRAKGVTLPDPDPMRSIKAFCRVKFNKPSMLQHVEQGKRTEVDALNGAIVREGRRLGIPTPFNEALTDMTKAVEAQRRAVVHEPPRDYDRLEALGKAQVEAEAARAGAAGRASPA